jgi:hypothetical protein
VRGHEELSGREMRTDGLLKHLLVMLIRQENADDVRPRTHLGDRAHVETVGLCATPRAASLVQADTNITSAFPQVLSVGVSLAAVTDNRDLLLLIWW